MSEIFVRILLEMEPGIAENILPKLFYNAVDDHLLAIYVFFVHVQMAIALVGMISLLATLYAYLNLYIGFIESDVTCRVHSLQDGGCVTTLVVWSMLDGV